MLTVSNKSDPRILTKNVHFKFLSPFHLSPFHTLFQSVKGQWEHEVNPSLLGARCGVPLCQQIMVHFTKTDN